MIAFRASWDEPRKPGPCGLGTLPRGTAPRAGHVELRMTSMSIGRRRPKLSRAQLRPRCPISLEGDPGCEAACAAGSACLVAVAVVATAMIVHGRGRRSRSDWVSGPSASSGCNVPEFKLRNQTKTSNERQAAADQVAPAMVNDPGPIRELADGSTT